MNVVTHVDLFDLVRRVGNDQLNVDQVGELIDQMIESTDARLDSWDTSVSILYGGEGVEETALLDTLMQFQPEQVEAIMVEVNEWGTRVTAKVRGQNVFVAWTTVIGLFESEREEIANS